MAAASAANRQTSQNQPGSNLRAYDRHHKRKEEVEEDLHFSSLVYVIIIDCAEVLFR